MKVCIEEESEVSFELNSEQQELLTRISKKRKGDNEELYEAKKFRVEQSAGMETFEEDEEIVEPKFDAIAEQEDELGSLSEEEEESVADQVSDKVVEDEFKAINDFDDLSGLNFNVDNESLEEPLLGSRLL